MINVVFAKMDTYLRYGQLESIDVRKLAQGKEMLSARSQSSVKEMSSVKQALDQKLVTKTEPTE
jgi:hypothetical protein